MQQRRQCGRRHSTHTHTHTNIEQSAMPGCRPDPKICDNWRFPIDIDKQICRNFNRLSLSLNPTQSALPTLHPLSRKKITEVYRHTFEFELQAARHKFCSNFRLHIPFGHFHLELFFGTARVCVWASVNALEYGQGHTTVYISKRLCLSIYKPIHTSWW